MLSYCIVSALYTPKVRILRRGRVYVLGRDAKADFPLPSDVISRRHAEILWSPEGGFQVRDLKSKNGTRVNDVPVMGTRLLADGDRVSIGPFTVQYREYQGDISQLLEENDEELLDATTALSRDVLAQAQLGTAALTGFGGKFGGHELLEIARLLSLGEKDGVLTVKGEELSGQLGFERGDIRSASAGDLRGEDAAHALLAVPTGQFEFTAGLMRLQRNCNVKTEGIAMEVARRLDESASRLKTPGVPQANDSATIDPRLLPDPSSAGTQQMRPEDPDDFERALEERERRG